jgi:hypothetical protein
MRRLFAPLLMLIARSTRSELEAQVEFLKVEHQLTAGPDLELHLKADHRHQGVAQT